MNFIANYLRRVLLKKTLLIMAYHPGYRMRNHRADRKKILLAMKITTILLLSACLTASAGGIAQRVTLSANNVQLGKIFKEIKKQTGYVFFYDARIMESAKPVSINVKNETVADVLKECLQGQPLDFSIQQKTITIIQKENYYVTKSPVLSQEENNLPPPAPVNIINGTVKDAMGKPLTGVSVIEKKTKRGTSTGANGSFSIEANVGDVLEFTMVGYQNKSVTVRQNNNINVIMEIEVSLADEVVVVGYGTQRKADITGSVSTVKAEDLLKVPTPQLAQALMGRVAGLFIKNIGGQPGDDNSVDFNIRGFSDEPLIIVDGMPATKQEFNQLNPNDIESFSVLKDASAAAIYGARAGDGVILVTTKQGKAGKPKFTLTSDYGAQYFVIFPDFVNASEYAMMQNLSAFNQDKSIPWTDEQIQKLKEGGDPKFQNNNWNDLTLRKFAPQWKQNLSVRGGNDQVKYFVSGGYYHQEALPKLNQTKLNSYNLRSNLSIALNKKLNLDINLAMNTEDLIEPQIGLEGRKRSSPSLLALNRNPPFLPLSYPDPTMLPGNENPLVMMDMNNTGYVKRKRMNGDIKTALTYQLPFNFTVKANFQVQARNERYTDKQTSKPTYDYDWDTDVYTFAGYTNESNSLSERNTGRTSINQQYFLLWNNGRKGFKGHKISAQAIYEVLASTYDDLSASRRDYVFDIDYLFAGPDLNKDNSGKGSRDGRKGLIGRVTYDYKGKYLFQASSRYDASPRFPPETRWGFFPSASVGWRISKEKFFSNTFPVISNLKFRASYGKLGKDKTGDFQYLDTYSQKAIYIFDNSNVLSSTIRADAIANPTITWEKMELTNVGIDFGLWNGKVEGSLEYFYRLRSDVLGSRKLSLPDVIGANLPKVNYGQYDNRGWELELNYRNRWNQFNFSVGGNVSVNREKVLIQDQNPFSNKEEARRKNEQGEWTDRMWGYMSEGLFTTQEEIDGWADLDGKGNASIRPGDLKVIDYNGDGKITSDDYVVIGRGKFPRFSYGINFNFDWKGFNFSMLWQGAGHFDIDLSKSRDFSKPWLGGDKTPLRDMLTNSYTPENPWIPANTDNARWPRYGDHAYSKAMTNKTMYATSEQWLIKGDYIRLKTVQLGYTFSSAKMRSLGLENLRVYLSGYNLLTLCEIDFLDPEANMSPKSGYIGNYYPITGTYNAGFVLTF